MAHYRILILASLVSTSLYADTTTIAKDDWLKKLQEVGPSLICKSFTDNKGVNQQLVAANITYEKCLTLIPPSFDKCQKQYYSDIPATLDETSTSKWGSTLGQCIGTDFAITYFKPSPTAIPPADATSSSAKPD